MLQECEEAHMVCMIVEKVLRNARRKRFPFRESVCIHRGAMVSVMCARYETVEPQGWVSRNLCWPSCVRPSGDLYYLPIAELMYKALLDQDGIFE